MTRKEFIEKIKSKALELQIRYIILPSLTISQAICESAGGDSSLASKYNNLFGFKWTKGCGYDYVELWTSEFVNGKYVEVKARFRKYKNWNESLEDYGRLIGTTNRYKPVRECKDYLCATEQIKKCKYATSPTYTQTLRGIIEQYKLYEFDNAKKEEQMKLTTYKKWSKGLPIEFVQRAINAYVVKIFAVADRPDWYPLDADGVFGPLTESGIECYQNENKLTTSKVVDKKTMSELAFDFPKTWACFCARWSYGER